VDLGQVADPPSSTASSDAGLGLLLVRGLVLAHLKVHMLEVVEIPVVDNRFLKDGY